MDKKKSEYPWDTISTNSLILPTELLSYYLFLMKLDSKGKRESSLKKDMGNILAYKDVLNRGVVDVCKTAKRK